jgi:hypothetical protein
LRLIDNRSPIGMGNRRQVFIHPDHPDLCVKIARNDHIRQSLDKRGGIYRLMPTHWRDDNWLEAYAYRQKALRDDSSPAWRHVPRLYGWQDSDLGCGLVFDFYRTAQGQPAPSLQQVLQSGLSNEQLDRALIELTQFLNTTDVWMRHPGPANIVLAADGRLKLIDCLGTYNMSYVVHHFSVLRRRRQVRHISYLHGAVTRMRQSAPLTAE